MQKKRKCRPIDCDTIATQQMQAAICACTVKFIFELTIYAIGNSRDDAICEELIVIT